MISPISGVSGQYAWLRPSQLKQEVPQEEAVPRSSAPRALEFNGITTVGPQATAQCETCQSRRYQDRSDDPGVSMQSPTALTPSQAESAVRSHEGEHVSRELSKAKEEGKVAYATVTLHTDVCPECGRVYIAGGTTRVVTKKSEPVGESTSQKPAQTAKP